MRESRNGRSTILPQLLSGLVGVEGVEGGQVEGVVSVL